MISPASSSSTSSGLRRRARVDGGFTLVELIITLAILAVLTSMAAPSFREALVNVRLNTSVNGLTSALRLGRSEAIKGAGTVAVCARKTDTECETGSTANWNKGWLVFRDPDSGSPGEVDDATDVLKVTSLTAGAVTVKAKAIVRPNAMAGQTSIRFSPRGRSNWTVGTLVLCDGRGASSAHSLVINGAGAVRASEGKGTPKDALGSAVTC